MKNDDYGSINTKCFECGRNCFRLTRMEKGQVLAECIHCSHAHILDAVLGKKPHALLLYWFSAPKKIERCVDCRSELKIWNVSYDGKMAQSKCAKCGLSHTFKKPRMRDWRLIRVTRRVDDEVSNLITASDLTEIKGIGSKRARILDLAGIKNSSDLAKSSIPMLSSKTGIPEQFLLNWIKQAKDLVN
ncbi:helix-hairpin-helix domain-containing protein [Thermoproteota archaeon]